MRRSVRRPSTDGAHVPMASVTHFLVKLIFAAPASFLSAAWLSQAVLASVSHFFKKLVLAAPASFLSVACAMQLASAKARAGAPISAIATTARRIVLVI